MTQMAQERLSTLDLAILEHSKQTIAPPEESMDWMTRFDPITHLPNRTVFDSRVRELLDEGGSAPSAAVVTFSLQRFSLIKAKYGLSVGHRLLRLVAGRIAGLAAPGETVAREQDDEFLILTPTSHRKQVDRVVSRFETAFREPFDLGTERVYVDASFGVARAPHDASSCSALVGSALVALHHAHSVLLTSVCFFEPSMFSQVTRNAFSSSSRGIKPIQDQIVVEYHPQVGFADGRMVGVEALVRAPCGSQGIPMSQFVRFAEYLRTRESWTETVVSRACGEVAECLSRPDTLYDGIQVAVKVNVGELMSDALAERIARCLEVPGLESCSLVLELPHEFRARDLPSCLVSLHDLRQLGVQICLADCGSSARCMSLLSRFEFDRVRLEKQLVSRLGAENGDTRALAKVIAGLAQSFGAECCAEGVETAAQAETLRQIGCETGQGGLFSLPVSKDQLTRLLAGVGSPGTLA